MDPYSTYPQAGYAPHYTAVVPPNQFYAPPPGAQQYTGFAAPYRSRYRRPSDAGTQTQELAPQTLRRGRSSKQTEEVPKISRPMLRVRKPSTRPGIAPDFIFISLSSHDVLRITNANARGLIGYLRETLIPYWPQRIVSDIEYDMDWEVKLGGEVWSAGGTHGIILFTVLAEEGFGYLATVDNHPMKSPRLVFASVPLEVQPRYFMIAFSLGRRTLTIIDAPDKLAIILGSALRAPEPAPEPNEAATTPRVRPRERWLADGVYEIVTGESGRQDVAYLMSGALKLIAAEGWRFEASVPFGKSGLFGLRGRREVWMFRRDPAVGGRTPKIHKTRRS